MGKDIEKAIIAEKAYLQEKVKGTQPNIYDFLQESEYTDLNEFYRDKQEYLLRHTEYVVVEEPRIGEDVPVEYIQNKQPAFLYTINCPESYAFVPMEFNDKEILDKYGFTMLKLGYSTEHGIILSIDGDLRIYLIIPESIDIRSTYFLSKMQVYLSSYFNNVRVDGNDIIIDNKKICGMAEAEYNDCRILLFQISYNDNAEMIREICGESIKTPGYIDSSVLPAITLKNEILSWLK